MLFKEAHPQCSLGKHVINYRIELARGLIGDYNSRKRISGCITTHSGHFPLKKVCEERQETQRLCGKCYYCSVNKIRWDTQWYCNKCQHFLCHTGKVEPDCFYIYHSNLSTILCFAFGVWGHVNAHASVRYSGLLQEYSSMIITCILGIF